MLHPGDREDPLHRRGVRLQLLGRRHKRRTATVHGPARHNNLVQLGGRRVLVIDVDGNRFEIEDYTSIDSRYSRLIESLL